MPQRLNVFPFVRPAVRAAVKGAGDGISRRGLVHGAAALGLSGAALPALKPRQVAAQGATPTAGSIVAIELAPGVTVEVFAGAPSNRASGQTVYLGRFIFQPGDEIFPHSHPGTTVLGVASGTFGWTLLEGTARIVRGAAAGATGPVEAITEPGTDVLLAPGDAIYYEDDVIHTARGASGDAPAVVMGTLVLTTGEPLLIPAEQYMT